MRVDLVDGNIGGWGIGLDNLVQPRWCTVVTTRPNDIAARLMALTDGQRDCLYLVYNHMKSKDIARILNVSPHTVDMRLRTAMRTLGATSRIEAARLLVQEDTGNEASAERYQSLIYQAPDVAEANNSTEADVPAVESAGDATAPIASEVGLNEMLSALVIDPTVNGPPRLTTASMDGQTSFGADRAGAGSFDPGPSTRPMVGSVPWGRRNDLSIGARLGWMFVIAVGSAMSFGAILGALAALKTLM